MRTGIWENIEISNSVGGSIAALVAQCLMQPGLGVNPVVICGSFRYAQRRRGFFERQAGLPKMLNFVQEIGICETVQFCSTVVL